MFDQSSKQGTEHPVKRTPTTALNNWPADKVERKAISELVPYANNARTHSDTQVDQIAASIREWGWTIPVLIDEEGTLIAGHGRVLAAQKLKLDDVPAMVAEGWTEAQKKAYVIADNKLALNADWNDDLIRVELDSLNDLKFDLKLTGFSVDEMDELYFDGNFAPGSEDDQGQLDKLEPKIVTCPSCGHKWDLRDSE